MPAQPPTSPRPPTPPRPTDVDEPNRLVAAHLYLVQHVVNSLASRYPRHVDRGELWSAGAFGLVDASRRYDPAAGIPFTRYATIRIRGAIIDSTRTRELGLSGAAPGHPHGAAARRAFRERARPRGDQR